MRMVTSMSWTKRDFITAAYEEIGYSSYQFDLQPEQQENALRKLDAMLATWNSKGLSVGYPLASSPADSDLDQETFVPDWLHEAIIYNLASRLGAPIGRQVPQSTLAAAKTAYQEALKHAAKPKEMKMPNRLPYGAGHKTYPTNTNFFINEDDGQVGPLNDSPGFTS